MTKVFVAFTQVTRDNPEDKRTILVDIDHIRGLVNLGGKLESHLLTLVECTHRTFYIDETVHTIRGRLRKHIQVIE